MAAKKTCLVCGNDFVGRSDATTCSPACRQRARRGKSATKCDTAVTDPAPAKRKRWPSVVPAAQSSVHSAEALAVLAGLDAELEANSRRRGLVKPMKWSTAEATLREMLANAIDRKVVLHVSWLKATDDSLRLKLSAEIRLLEASVARYVGQIKTDLPADPSLTTTKAQRAANTRWDRDRARS